MPYTPLDEDFFEHPKAIAAGPLARELNFVAWCWVQKRGTDGKVPKNVVPALAGLAGVKATWARKLVEVGLWDELQEYYVIHDWLKVNKSRDEVKTLQEARRAGGRKGASRRWTTESSTGSSTETSMGQPIGEPMPEPVGEPVGGPMGEQYPQFTIHEREREHPPTTESRWPVENLGAGAAPREGEVMKSLITVERNGSGPVKNRAAWDRAVRERLDAEHGPEIRRLCAKYPDAPPDVIASHLRGEGNGLRYYTPHDA